MSDHAATAGKLERRLFLIAAAAGGVAIVCTLFAAAGSATVSSVLTMLP